MEKIMELATRQFVRPEAHNHHETVYAGRLADWMTEAAMIGVTKLLGRNDYVVLAALKEVRIKKPMTAGMILQFEYEVAKLGTTSIDILPGKSVWARRNPGIQSSPLTASVDAKTVIDASSYTFYKGASRTVTIS